MQRGIIEIFKTLPPLSFSRDNTKEREMRLIVFFLFSPRSSIRMIYILLPSTVAAIVKIYALFMCYISTKYLTLHEIPNTLATVSSCL